MPISVMCQCGKQYNLRDEHAGKTMRCKVCGERMQVPTPRTANAPDSSRQAVAPVIIEETEPEAGDFGTDYGSDYDDYGDAPALPAPQPRATRSSKSKRKSGKRKPGKRKSKDTDTEKNDPPWKGLLCSLGSIGFGFLMLFLFGNLEQNGGSMRLPVWVIAIYKLFGRWGLFWIFTVVGILGIIVSFGEMLGLIKPSDDDDD